jgi:uncharacterized membrane protein
MTKHRLELFSDGVFAIILTLLVLDLRVPASQGLAGLREIIPALLVHAASFYVVGSFWTVHYGAMARISEIGHHTLMLNLLSLFWATLIPFAAHSAAERPLDPLGAGLLAGATGGYLSSLVWLRLTAHSAIDDNPGMKSWRRFRVVLISVVILADLVAAAVAWLSPWPAYAIVLATATTLFILPSPPQVEQRLAPTTAVKAH